EVLYCECCGTQLLAGHKIPVRTTDIVRPQVGGRHTLPGVTALAVSSAFELTAQSSRISGLPEQFAEVRTDAQVYSELGVVWLKPAAWSRPDDVSMAWTQKSEELDGSRHKAEA